MQPVIIEVERAPKGVLVLDAKRMAAVAFAVTLVCGALFGAAYVAGRNSVAAGASQRIAPVSAPAPVRIVELGPKPVAVAEPEEGFYLQVTSVPRGVAEVIAQGLIANGFEAKAAPGAGAAVARVLVGPLSTEQVAATRERLQNLGFHPFPRRVD